MNQDRQFEQSVTDWIQALKCGEADALTPLWERYFSQVVELARVKMKSIPRRDVDEEDIALEVMFALGEGATGGRFTQLQDRHDLWHLLFAMTSCRVVDRIRRHRAQRYGGGRVRGDSAVDRNPEVPGGFDRFLSNDPPPEFLVSLEEETRHLFAILNDDVLRAIAKGRLEGRTNAELAQSLSISIRSIERKVAVIRKIWQERIEETSG